MLTPSYPTVAGNNVNQVHVLCLENQAQPVISWVLVFPVDTCMAHTPGEQLISSAKNGEAGKGQEEGVCEIAGNY